MKKIASLMRSHTTSLWLALITSLLVGSSAFTLMKVRGVFEADSKARINDEAEQVVEKFGIIDSLLSEWLDRAISELQKNSLDLGPARLDEFQTQRIDTPSGSKLVPRLSFGSVEATSRSLAVSRLAKTFDSSVTVFVRDGNRMIRLLTSIRMKGGQSAVGTELDPDGPVLPVLLKGQPYRGPARILGNLYYTRYVPIFDASGSVIGAWYAGYDINSVGNSIRNSIRDANLQDKTYMMILDDSGQVSYSSEGTPPSLLEGVVQKEKSDSLTGRAASLSVPLDGFKLSVIPYKPWGMQIITASSPDVINELALNLSAGVLALQLLAIMATVLLSVIYSQRLSKAMKDAMLSRNQAEEANRAKSSFLANMSHELRTPMNAIIGYSEILTEECEEMDPDEIRDDLAKILSSARHLLNLINGVLDLSKIEAGKMTIYAEDISLASLIDEALSSVKPLVEKNKNQLAVTLPLNPDDQIRVDVTKLKQVVLNLVSNACKFTDSGVISIEADLYSKDSLSFLSIRVKDSGIGMTPEQMQRLFQDFSQADASTTKKYGGTGLGLSLSRRFCRLMGGDIQVSSELGAGSCFEILLPREYEPNQVNRFLADPSFAHDAQVLKAAFPALSGNSEAYPVIAALGKVLIVDDDIQVADVIQRRLTLDGYAVMSSLNGSEGLQKARTWKPDLIALDINMPGKSGWDVLSELKSDDQLSEIPVVLISKDAEGLDLKPLHTNAYSLAKPIDWNLLDAVLNQAIRDSNQEFGYILVLEKGIDIASGLEQILSGSSYRVKSLVDTASTLEVIAAERPSLILIDVKAEGIDGVSFAESLHRNPLAAHLPIILLNAQGLSIEEQKKLQGRFTGFISSANLDIDLISEKIKAFCPLNPKVKP